MVTPIVPGRGKPREECSWEILKRPHVVERTRLGFQEFSLFYHQNKIPSNNSLRLALLVIHHSVLNT